MTAATSSPNRHPRRSRYRLARKPQALYAPEHLPQGMAVLVALDALGLLTNGQIRDLLFADLPTIAGTARSANGARKKANEVCQRLWEGGLITRKPAILTSHRTGQPYLHFVNVLSAAGAWEVASHYEETGEGALRWTRSSLELKPQQIAHTLAINDVHIAAARASARAGVAFRSWHDDRQLMGLQRDGQAHFVTVPDGYFVLEHEGRAFGHFLEVDRGTETVTGPRTRRANWGAKIRGYGHYLAQRAAGEALLTGATAPIVLTVTTSQERLEHMLEATRKAGGAGRYWYTTAAQLLDAGDPAAFWAPIWRVCSDPLPRSLHERLRRAR